MKNKVLLDALEAEKFVIDHKIVCVGLLCITAYGIYAMSQGTNGTLMAVIIGIICTAIGVTIPTPKILKNIERR